MIEALPAPLVPAEVDLRGLEWMPYYGDRLARSEFNARADDATYRAAHNLWWSAWNSVPAGSLPDDEVALARYADLGRDVRSWRRIKEQALHGFILCSDGRWYHEFLCQRVLEAWDRRVRERARKAKWRADRDGVVDVPGTGTSGDSPNHGDGDKVGSSASQERGKERSPDAVVPVSGMDDRTGEDRTGQDKERKKISPSLRSDEIAPGSQRAKGKSPRQQGMGGDAREADTEFERWYLAYPRHVGKGAARRAYPAARRKVEAEMLVAATMKFADQVAGTEHRFIPHPSTWLNAERWLDEAKSPPEKPTGAGVADTADFDRLFRIKWAGKVAPNGIRYPLVDAAGETLRDVQGKPIFEQPPPARDDEIAPDGDHGDFLQTDDDIWRGKVRMWTLAKSVTPDKRYWDPLDGPAPHRSDTRVPLAVLAEFGLDAAEAAQ